MKQINHNYWKDYEGRDADSCNPDLREAMQELYGEKGFKFQSSSNYDDCVFECSPDAYSSYTSFDGNYIESMPFRKECVKNNKDLADEIYNLSGTIAGELFFPCHRNDCKTINQARGTTEEISDRIDLTLRDIKYFYDKREENYPLKDVLNRYKDFFSQFGDFKGYVDYCLLKDFCKENYEVDLWKDEEGLPKNEEELVNFWEWSIEKLKARAKRIEDFIKQKEK